MSARPNVGVPPKRSLSVNLIQRPSPNRTLSQQFAPSSPVRRSADATGDLGQDALDVLGRYATIPRNGGSRLRLEITKDSSDKESAEAPNPTKAPAWKPSLPPRGKPRLHAEVFAGSREALDGGGSSEVGNPIPLPVRPGRHAPRHPRKEDTAPVHSVKKDIRPKPYVLEVSPAAPHYSPNGHADFFPWTGNHPEDQFSESVIKQGYFDKNHTSQVEMSSGKPMVFPSLKHKSALQTLSALFTSVLAQRRSHGQITSSSSFKPPPRVTVTDTKREMWLKDLANPTISLRKLSRSIPHGIRGKVLLDQSLTKNIPIERAVWLAKCVGANELRAFRRKGASGAFAMGGEAKWIRDFTVCVEQFVESIVASCGEKDFKSRINYAVRLAAYFHAENLLDREHYMDWLVSSFENSPQVKLPIWLLITQIYWKDLLRYRKFGKRLSAALLSHVADIDSHPDADIFAPLSERLRFLLKGLLISNAESFVQPKVWEKHKASIESCLGSDDRRLAAVFASIDRRNRRLSVRGAQTGSSTRVRLIKFLDSVLLKSFSDEVSKESWQIDTDKAVLMQTLLEWSTSSYRPGTAKTFIATRILRQWSRHGANISGAILSFLDSKACGTGRNKPALYHLVSELARSGHFSVSVYLQWLITRGGLRDASDIAEDAPCATRVLLELPTHNINDSLVALRTTLLRRVGFSVDDEEDQMRRQMIQLKDSLPGMNASVDIDSDTDEVMTDYAADLSSPSRCIRSEVGLWLREQVRLQMQPPSTAPLEAWETSSAKGAPPTITLTDFNVVRHALERFGDFSMLADVLKAVLISDDSELLASCADTLNLNFDSFAAIGALNDLFEQLLGRMKTIAGHSSFPRVLLVSLSNLAARVPEQKLVEQQLSQELAQSDRKTAADACSPVSDHMAGIMQTAEADFTDEIEKILASGNSMDQPTLERLFQRIAVRFEESWGKSGEQHRSCGLLFTRLRTFNAPQFDSLMTSWVLRFMQMEKRPSLTQVLGPLISFGCLDLCHIINSFATESAKEPRSLPTSISKDVLALLFGPSDLPDIMTAEDSYRLRIKQNFVLRDHPAPSLSVVHAALEASSGTSSSQSSSLQSPFTAPRLHELLQRVILQDQELMMKTLISPLLQGSDTATTASILVDSLLLSERKEEEGAIPIESVISLADDFTLPFCRVKLACLLHQDKANTAGDEEAPSPLQAFDKAIANAVSEGNTAWTCIVPLLDPSVASHLRTRAEARFLALFPSLATLAGDAPAHHSIQEAKNLLCIIYATAESQPDKVNGPLTTETVNALDNLWLILSSHQASASDKETVYSQWLPLLLSFATSHSALEPTKSSHGNHNRAFLALAGIFLELEAREPLPNTPTITEQTLDFAFQLIDAVPDDVRQQCIRSLHSVSSNPRIAYLFSIPRNPSDWLFLSQREKIVSATSAGGGSTPISESERLSLFPLRRWEMLGEPTPNVGENDTSLSLTLFGARRG